VTAVNLSTNRQFTEETTESGLFNLRAVPPGFYKVTIEAKGFRTLELDRVDVQVSRDTGLGSLKLEIGQVGEVVQLRKQRL
jgi:hypothetical protein